MAEPTIVTPVPVRRLEEPPRSVTALIARTLACDWVFVDTGGKPVHYPTPARVARTSPPGGVLMVGGSLSSLSNATLKLIGIPSGGRYEAPGGAEGWAPMPARVPPPEWNATEATSSLGSAERARWTTG
jgi:hypothetical protein